MDAGWAAVIAAVVAAVGAIIVATLDKFRKENQTDHQVVVGLLHVLRKSQLRVEDKVERLDERLDSHIEFHAVGGMLDKRTTIHKDGAEKNRNLSA